MLALMRLLWLMLSIRKALMTKRVELLVRRLVKFRLTGLRKKFMNRRRLIRCCVNRPSARVMVKLTRWSRCVWLLTSPLFRLILLCRVKRLRKLSWCRLTMIRFRATVNLARSCWWRVDGRRLGLTVTCRLNVRRVMLVVLFSVGTRCGARRMLITVVRVMSNCVRARKVFSNRLNARVVKRRRRVLVKR